MFIDESYFTGPFELAQLGSTDVVDKLSATIRHWEPIIMEAALGYDFYHALLEGLNVGSDEVTEQRWLDLLNGTSFNSLSGIKKNFRGLAYASTGFIYYEFMKAKSNQDTGIGIVKNKSENSEPASPAGNMANAWNLAAKQMDLLWEFLQAKTTVLPNVYPEYSLLQVNNLNYWNWNYPFSISNSNYMNPLF